MAKKSFTAGGTKTGILNSDGGEKLKEIQAKTQYNFKYIPKDKIVSNPKNEMYTQDGINALKESILVNGLRHNLSVLYDSDKDIYRLISGERRYHAISEMDEKNIEELLSEEIARHFFLLEFPVKLKSLILLKLTKKLCLSQPTTM